MSLILFNIYAGKLTKEALEGIGEIVVGGARKKTINIMTIK